MHRVEQNVTFCETRASKWNVLMRTKRLRTTNVISNVTEPDSYPYSYPSRLNDTLFRESIACHASSQ